MASKRRFRLPFSSKSKNAATAQSPSSSLDAITSSSNQAAHPASRNHSPLSKGRKLGLLLLTPKLPDDQLDELSPDIIAIHGISGDPFKSWTHKNGALWLRDFLPKDVRGARVFSFGYDAEVAFTKSKATLDDFAMSLLNKIKSERNGKRESRPLVFICHSMGGIVLKRALALARLEDDDEFPLLRSSIKGIFFLGTPHRGSDAMKWPQLLANISNIGFYPTSGLIGSSRNDLLQNLERNSETLKTISSEFRNQVKNIKIVSCIEQHTTPPLSKLIVDQDTGTTNFPGEIIITMDGCDHCTMCRFSSDQDQNYRVLRNRINELLIISKQVLCDPTECLKYLSFKEMEDRKHEIHLAAESTCEWLLQDKRFEQWNEKGGLIWIKGNPGTGKSTMMKYALERTSHGKHAIQNELVVLSFFFHARGSPLQHSHLGFYRSILHQILSHIPVALSDLVSDFEKNLKEKGTPGQNWEWHESQLRAFLEASIPKILQYRSIVLFVDALDETGEIAVHKLVKEFQNLTMRHSKTSSSIFGICFSCRPYPIIEFKGGLEICIDQENFGDVETYIQRRLPNEKDQIRETIIRRASNSFQWARLVVDRVEDLRRNGKGEKMIRDVVLRIPLELNDLYRELLESLDNEENLEALRLFQWLLFPMRPLSLDELRFATAMAPNLNYTSLRQCKDEGTLAEDNAEMEKRVKSLSRGLAEIQIHDDISMAQLIHQSVNDFMLDGGLQILWGEKWQSLDSAIGSANSNLARSCIRYIDMEEVALQKNTDWWKVAKSGFPFLRYATISWQQHVKQAITKGTPQVDLVEYFHWPLEDLLERWVNIYNTINRYSPGRPAKHTNLLHVASGYGILDLLSTALGTLDEIEILANSEDNNGRTPLSWAAGSGHEAIVKLLLDTNKVETDSKDSNGQTPLSWAARSGHEATVKLLLDTNKVEIDSKDSNGQTPLSWAAENGHEAIVKLLLDTNKVEIDSKDSHGQTPLSWAAGNGHEAMVKLLLDTNKVEIDLKDARGRTPLSWAQGRGHEDIVQLLLKYGADISLSPDW